MLIFVTRNSPYNERALSMRQSPTIALSNVLATFKLRESTHCQICQREVMKTDAGKLALHGIDGTVCPGSNNAQ
jgi:hypothetical protein